MAILEQAGTRGVRERVAVALGGFSLLRGPVVLRLGPDIADRGGTVIKSQAVDTLLATAGQPLHPHHAAPGTEGSPCGCHQAIPRREPPHRLHSPLPAMRDLPGLAAQPRRGVARRLPPGPGGPLAMALPPPPVTDRYRPYSAGKHKHEQRWQSILWATKVPGVQRPGQAARTRVTIPPGSY